MPAADIVARLTLNAQEFSKSLPTAFSAVEKAGKDAADRIGKGFETSFQRLNKVASDLGKIDVGIGNTSAAAAGAEQQAKSYGVLAAQYERAGAAAGGMTQQQQQLAAAARIAEREAQQEAQAFRDQERALINLRAELTGTANAQSRVTAQTASHRQGVMQLSYNIGDLGASYASGAHLGTIFAQQLGQTTQALALMEGTAGRVGKFLMNPWVTGVTVAATVLGVLVGKLSETSEKADKAKEALEDFAKHQADIGNFIEATTGKLKEQNTALVTNAILSRRADIREKQKLIDSSKGAAFDATRSGILRAGQAQIGATTSGVTFRDDVDVQRAIAAAGGNADKLSANLARLAQTTRPDLQKLALDVGNIGGQAVLAKREIERLEKEVGQLTGAVKGQTAVDSASIERQVALETATSDLERARAKLAIVQANGAKIAKDDAKAAAAYKDQLTAATKAIQQAEAAEKAVREGRKAARKEETAAEREAKEHWKYQDLALKAGQQAGAANTLDTQVRREQDRVASLSFEKAQDQVDKLGEKLGETFDEVNARYERAGLRAVESIADAFASEIGGKAGNLVGDLFSLAGGGRANNPVLRAVLGDGAGGGIFDPASIKAGFGDVFDPLKDEIRKLGTSFMKLFGEGGDFSRTVGQLAGGALLGSQAGVLGTDALGTRGSKVGGALGGVAGQALGKIGGEAISKAIGGTLGKSLGALGGPLGSAIGGIAGSAIMGAFKKVKWGSSTISFANGSLSAGEATGNSKSAKSAASATASGVVDSLQGILDQLGGTIVSAPSITVGQRHGDYRVNVNGTSLKVAKGAMDFDGDQTAAARYAVQQMLAGAVLDGISDASKKILKDGSQDLEDAITKAGLIEAIPKSLKARLDPVGAAIDELNAKWEKTIAALREGGATAEQMAEAQKLYGLELDEVKNSTRSASQSLKDFVKDLGFGSNSPLSLRDQEKAAAATLQPFLDKIATGATIDQDAYRTAAQSYLDIERDLYGSSAKYFDEFNKIQDATAKAIQTIDNAVSISTAKDPFAEKTASATQASANILEQLSDQTAQQQQTLDAILAALKSGSSFIDGSIRSFG